MGTLADITPDMDEVKSAVYRVLAPDSTLQGANYLTAAGHVVAQEIAQENLAPPRLHILLFSCEPEMETGQQRATFALRAVTKNLGDGMPGDRARSGRILQRAGQIAVGTRLFTASGYKFFDSWIESIGELLVDPGAPEESTQDEILVVRFTKL
jgi:hypothetical protein